MATRSSGRKAAAFASKDSAATAHGPAAAASNPAQRTPGGHRSELCRNVLRTAPDQAVLDLLAACAADTFARPDFGQQLVSIKKSFVERDYDAVFKTPAHLPIYAAQYTPGRALCYLDLIRTEPLLLRFLLRRQRLRTVCLGGGAGSEIVALAAARALLAERRAGDAPASGDASAAAPDGSAAAAADRLATLDLQPHPVPVPAAPPPRLTDLHVYDMGDWGDVLTRQAEVMRERWQFAAGAAAGELRFRFVEGDILDMAASAHGDLLRELARADLVTAMFVINELFVSRERTLALLKVLLEHMRPGALLLVVDSAGDFSHLQVGRRTFMVYTLLDSLRGWRQLVAHDAQWYRVPPGLRYPLEVQNMRYFVRLYQRERDEPPANVQ